LFEQHPKKIFIKMTAEETRIKNGKEKLQKRRHKSWLQKAPPPL
jgi:hypothetical protein